MVDAAEFSCPAFTYPMGLHEIAKFVLIPRHPPALGPADIFINQKSWEALPADLKAIVEICASELQTWSTAWHEYANAQAIIEMKKEGVQFVTMDEATRTGLRKVSQEYLDSLKAKNAFLGKVLTSQENFQKYYAPWREAQGGVAPWPYEDYIKGKHFH